MGDDRMALGWLLTSSFNVQLMMTAVAPGWRALHSIPVGHIREHGRLGCGRARKHNVNANERKAGMNFFMV
nr:hypothetical protein [Bacillota bacterium]